MSNFDRQALYEAMKKNTNITLSNTVWVNLNLTENDIKNRIFKTWLDAKDWILANTTVSEANLQQIMLPSGNVGNITLYEGIRLSVTDGTVIENLSSSVTFDGDYNTLFKAYIAGAQINNLDLQGDGKCCALFNCVVNNVIPATSTVVYVANDCQFLAGDFENYSGVQSKCRYIPILGDIDNLSLNGSFNELALVDDMFELNCIDINAQFSNINVTSISESIIATNCKIDELFLSSSAHADIMNTSIEALICESVGSYGIWVRNCLIKTAIAQNGGELNLLNCVIDEVETKDGGATNIRNSTCSIKGSGNANIRVYTSTLGQITLEDTAYMTYENSCIFYYTPIVAAGATLTRISEPFDNTVSGLTATNVQDAIDELKALITPTPEPTIFVTPDTLAVIAAGETKTTTVTATSAYVVDSKPDWITATIDGEICTLVAEPNATGVERSGAVVLILSDNPNVKADVTVTQAGE